MNTHQPDFVSVDMRGLKTALVERAQAERESLSVLVRRAVARELGVREAPVQSRPDALQGLVSGSGIVKLSIRLTTSTAHPPPVLIPKVSQPA